MKLRLRIDSKLQARCELHVRLAHLPPTPHQHSFVAASSVPSEDKVHCATEQLINQTHTHAQLPHKSFTIRIDLILGIIVT